MGGAKEDYESCLPLFEAMGNNINYEGAAGAGTNTKLANQIMIAGTISGLCEALSYARPRVLIFRLSLIRWQRERREAVSLTTLRPQDN